MAAPELKIDRSLLERWLRFDLRGDGKAAEAANGISKEELELVCDRGSAMHAGARLLLEVEGEEGARAAGAGPWLPTRASHGGALRRTKARSGASGGGIGRERRRSRASSPMRSGEAEEEVEGDGGGGGITCSASEVKVVGSGYEFVCHSTAHLDGLGTGGGGAGKQ